ncbi:hypothetical protein [Brachybacterium kimchii]|uniref:Uncharacterized protein n=1 Tax=Brachybacterium kimchii TaxID=2942909 RepID=A0ABY4N9M6_9MICO|nr:hypothetical protein [Brachybacterium kimchii]UQN30502.1 hypothetical protein M4486_03930 [Brachybacterium kimchii]
MSEIFNDALHARRLMREEFELHRHASYQRAYRDLNGELLNDRGRAAHVDPYSLFMGNGARAYCYASEELRDWWEDHDRPTVESFEAHWWRGRFGYREEHPGSRLREIA